MPDRQLPRSQPHEQIESHNPFQIVDVAVTRRMLSKMKFAFFFTLVASVFFPMATQSPAWGEDGANTLSTTSDPVGDSNAKPHSQDATSSDRMNSLIQALRDEEARYADYLATWRKGTTLARPGMKQPAEAGRRPMSVVITGQQRVKDRQFKFLSDTVTTWSSGEKLSYKHETVFNGTRTISIEDDNCVTEYVGASEPLQLLPPHCWGVFHLGFSCPLSIYLTGTAALTSHPKVARLPGMVTEDQIAKLEAEIVGDELVENVDCVIVRVQRWYHVSEPPEIQYFWLAKHRNLQVARSRTAYLSWGIEVPKQESRVTKWRKFAPDVWYPKLIEIFDITPQMPGGKNPASAIDQLIIDSAELKPDSSDDEFRLPEIPESLPKFTVDEHGQLSDSPLHPQSVAKMVTTTLEEILDRLKVEEAKYDPCELTLFERDQDLHKRSQAFRFWSDSDRGDAFIAEIRRRSLLDGIRRLRDLETFCWGWDGSSEIAHYRAVDDGRVRQEYSVTPGIEGNDRTDAFVRVGAQHRPIPVAACPLAVDGFVQRWDLRAVSEINSER